MATNVDDDEPPACAICTAAAKAFQPYNLSLRPSMYEDDYCIVSVGKATLFHRDMRCSTCQVIYSMIDQRLERGFGCPRARASKSVRAGLCGGCTVEIRLTRRFRVDEHFLMLACFSGTDSIPWKVDEIGHDKLRPHTSVVQQYIRTTHKAFREQRYLVNRVDRDWPTWYPSSYGNCRDFGIALPQGPVDLSRIARWIELCDKTHLHCRHRGRPEKRAQLRPKLLVDVANMCITDEIPDSPVYVTLSYVWGNLPWSLATYTANYDSLRKPGSLNLHEYAKAVPRTISDAIGLCRGMGIPYFWVDKLCIVQDDESNLRDQISIMDQIYKHSYFTLICADGNDANHGLPGVGGTPRAYRPNAHLKFSSAIQFSQPIQEESETSPWHQRAWTLQERALSSRTLVFHDQTVYWQCATITWYETSSADEQVDRLSSTLNRSGIGRLPRFPAYALSQVSSLSIFDEKPIPNFIDYVQLVGGYSARLLGFPSDAERAFSAILHELSRSFHGGFFYGLPTLLFDVSLLWVFQEEGTPQRRAGFPSWSWLGWEAPVYLISMVGHTPINADDMWNPWELFDHENGGIPTSSNFDWRSFEPLTTWWRVSKDGRRSYISNSHSSWLRFRDDVSAGDWRRHSLNYFKHRESWDHWYYPINDSDTNATIGDRSHTRWKLLPRRDNLEEAGLAGPDETEGWEEDTTEFYTNGNWPGLFFRHPFPVVENVERMAESSDEWLPFLEFRTQSFRLKPVHIISGGDVGRDKILHLEHEAFPGNLLGELHPNDSVNPESLLGTDCEFITLARLSHPVRLGGYRDVAEYAVAALWIDWADGVAYRKGLAFLYGPRWERTPDDTGMTETVHSFEDCPHVMRDVRLG